jgi:hypothetical protein
MSQVAIKITCNAALAHRLRAAALARGTCLAHVVREACEKHVPAPASVPDDALIEAHEGHKGKRVVGALLSGKLASAVSRLAAETRNSQSWALRLLVREGARARGLLEPTAPTTADQVGNDPVISPTDPATAS